MDTKFKLNTTDWLQISLPAGEYTIIPLDGFDDYIYADSLNPDTLIADVEIPLSGQIRITLAELNSIYLKAQHTDGEVVFSAQLTHGTIPLGAGVTYKFTQPLSELNGDVSLSTLPTHFKTQNQQLALSDDVVQTLDYAKNLIIPSYTFSNPITNTANRIALKHDQTQFKTSLANGLELHDDVTRKLDKIQRLRFEDPFLNANGTITIQLENTTLMVRAGKLDLTDDVKLALQKANATITYNAPLKNTQGNISLSIDTTDLKVDRNNQLALSDRVTLILDKANSLTLPTTKDPITQVGNELQLNYNPDHLAVNAGRLELHADIKDAIDNIHQPISYRFDSPLEEQGGTVTLKFSPTHFTDGNTGLELHNTLIAKINKIDTLVIPTYNFTGALDKQGDNISLTINPAHFTQAGDTLNLHSDITDALARITTITAEAPIERDRDIIKLKSDPAHFETATGTLKLNQTIVNKLEVASVSLPSNFIAYVDMASAGANGIGVRDGNWALTATATYTNLTLADLTPSPIHKRMIRLTATLGGEKSISAPFQVKQNIQALTIQFMFAIATNPPGTPRDTWQPLVKLSKQSGGKWSGGANFNYSTRQFEILGVAGAKNWSGNFQYDHPYIVTIQYTPTGVTAWCDNIKIVDNAPYNGVDFPGFDSVKGVRTLNLGTDGGNKRYLLDLGQVVIFDRLLSDDEIKYAVWLQGEKLSGVLQRRCSHLENALSALEKRVAALEVKSP